jgi:hypothetical protein
MHHKSEPPVIFQIVRGFSCLFVFSDNQKGIANPNPGVYNRDLEKIQQKMCLETIARLN